MCLRVPFCLAFTKGRTPSLYTELAKRILLSSTPPTPAAAAFAGPVFLKAPVSLHRLSQAGFVSLDAITILSSRRSAGVD